MSASTGVQATVHVDQQPVTTDARRTKRHEEMKRTLLRRQREEVCAAIHTLELICLSESHGFSEYSDHPRCRAAEPDAGAGSFGVAFLPGRQSCSRDKVTVCARWIDLATALTAALTHLRMIKVAARARLRRVPVARRA